MTKKYNFLNKEKREGKEGAFCEVKIKCRKRNA
jgi:hypothetical protein